MSQDSIFTGCHGLLRNNAHFQYSRNKGHGQQVIYYCDGNTHTAEGRAWGMTTCSDGEWIPKPQCSPGELNYEYCMHDIEFIRLCCY